MRAILCDFCGTHISQEAVKFEKDGKKCRIDISVLHVQNGVRYKRADACPACIIGFALKAKEIYNEQILNDETWLPEIEDEAFI